MGAVSISTPARQPPAVEAVERTIEKRDDDAGPSRSVRKAASAGHEQSIVPPIASPCMSAVEVLLMTILSMPIGGNSESWTSRLYGIPWATSIPLIRLTLYSPLRPRTEIN